MLLCLMLLAASIAAERPCAFLPIDELAAELDLRTLPHAG